MTMGPVGERFARTPRQFDTGKRPLRSDSLFAVNPEGSTPTRYSPTAIILLLVSSVSYAQNVPSEREEIQQLVLQVKALQERVRVLESQQGANSTARTEDPGGVRWGVRDPVRVDDDGLRGHAAQSAAR